MNSRKALWIGIAVGATCLALVVLVPLGLYVAARPGGDSNQLAQQGWQQWQERKLIDATASFNKAVKLDPKNANAWNGLGWASLNSANVPEAEKAFLKVLELQPDHPAALNGMGQIRLGQKKYDEAETYLLKAAPQAPAAWYGLTRIYLLQEKFDKAQEWAQKLVDSGQGDDSCKQMLAAAKEKKLDPAFRQMLEPR